MVTKPTGRPRGRPRSNPRKETAAPVGRPKLDFLLDPDRYLVAFFEAHVVTLGTSNRNAAKVLAAFTVGNEIESPIERRSAVPKGYVALAWGPQGKARADGNYFNTRAGSSSATIIGRAVTIRAKAKAARSDPKAKDWLTAMTMAFGLTLDPRVRRQELSLFDLDEIVREVFIAAKAVGEGDIFRRDIVPMITMNYMSD